MTTTCPNGHESNDPEWCDTCGERLGSEPVPAPITASVPSIGSRTPALGSPATSAGGGTGADAATTAARPIPPTASSARAAATTSRPASLPPSVTAPDTAAPVLPLDPTGTDWSVAVEVDPDWYGIKGTDSGAPCPPVSRSVVPLTGNTALIGRTSRDRESSPEITLNDDPGVSRRHAQLVSDDEGVWSVVDLGSMNGTFVVEAGERPDASASPLVQGDPVPATDGTRIYLGAWSRLTLTDNRGTR